MKKVIWTLLSCLVLVGCEYREETYSPPRPNIVLPTCDEIYAACRQWAGENTFSIFSYMALSMGCVREQQVCNEVGIDEYAAIWTFVCPSLGYGRTSTVALD